MEFNPNTWKEEQKTARANVRRKLERLFFFWLLEGQTCLTSYGFGKRFFLGRGKWAYIALKLLPR